MVIVKKQAVSKRNQRKLKKDKKVLQVKKQDEYNDNKVMNMAVSDGEEDDNSFESHKFEQKEIDLDLEEDDGCEDSDEGFLEEKLSNLKTKSKKLKLNKEENKVQPILKKAKKAKKEGNIQNNKNQDLMKVTIEDKDIKIVACDRTKEHYGESQEKKDARSLYIGKLPSGVTKQDLKDLSKDIVEVYLQKRTDGPNSRFAFIRFDDEATAEANYKVLQRMKIRDEPCTVDYVGSKSSFKDLNSRKERNSRKLYVGNLPDDITEKELKNLSEDIVEVLISQGKKKFAYLLFKDKEAAQANLNILKTKKIKGQPLTAYGRKNLKLKKVVASDKPKDHSGESQETKDARSLFIGKLTNDVRKRDLKELSKDIVEVYIQKKMGGPNSRFAVIRFDDEGTAEANYRALQRMKIKNQPFTVDYVGSKSSYQDVNLKKERSARTLYIGDLPADITEKELKSLSGDIVETFISKGKKIRFAFLIFDSEGKAQSNYEVLKAKKIRDQPLVVKFSTSGDSITEKEEDGHDEESDNAEDDAVDMDLKNGENDDDIDEESPKKKKVAVEKEQASEKSKEHTKESREESDARSLYIGKLPDGVTEQDLKDLSEDIIEIYFPQKHHGGNNRFAFIRFSDEATAASNLTVLQSKTIKDQPLTVDYCGSKSTFNKDSRKEDRNARKLFVGSLPEDVTETDFKSLSEDIVEIFISQGPKKYAFLTFDSKDKAESNYEIFKDQKIRGQQIFVDHNRSKSGSYGLKQISVSGLPLDVTIEQVAGYFKKAFQITLNRSSSQRTATISFDTEQDAKEANDAAKDATIISEHKLALVLCENNENRPERGGGFGGRGQFRGGRGNFGGCRGNFGGGRGQFGGGRGQFRGGRNEYTKRTQDDDLHDEQRSAKKIRR